MFRKNELIGIFYDAISTKKFAQDEQRNLLRNSIETKESLKVDFLRN